MAEGSRSPNYPAVTLADALAAVGKLWAAEKRTPVDNETAVKHFGFKSLSGPARVMIGAVRQYGLIDKTGLGRFKLSDRAIRALHGTDDEKAAAIREAALYPALFKELAENFLDGSEAAIISYLVTKKGFIDSGAKIAAKAFRNAMTLGKIAESGYNPEKDGDSEKDKNADLGDGPMDGAGAQEQMNYGFKSTGAAGTVKSDLLSLNVPYGKGTISVQVRVTGEALTAQHIARVCKYLELAKEDLGTDE
jgi:hypothetical protein